MKTFLPSFNFVRTTCLAAVIFFTSFSQSAVAQLNLLANPSFEFPRMSILNGNNIIGAALAWNGWNCTNGGLNIIHVIGSGYASGANHAADGDQYADVNSSGGYISTTFLLLENSPITFRGAFSNREAGWNGYAPWTGKVEVLNLLGNVVATSNTVDFVTTTNQEDWYTVSGSSSTLPPGIYTYRAYAGDWGHFDDAAVYALNSSVLPIKLEGFSASLKDKGVEVNWTVGEELNVKNYEVQFGTDGKNFKTIGVVTAKNSKNYSFDHNIAMNGVSYYRLMTVDNDGRSSFSSTCKISVKGNASLYAYPNPVNDVLNISIASGMVRKPGTVTVIAMNGRVMHQKQFASLSQQEAIDMSKLSPGSYIVSVVVGYEVMNKAIQVIR